MTKFKNRFTKFLQEAIDAEAEKEAFADTLELDTNPDQLGADMDIPAETTGEMDDIKKASQLANQALSQQAQALETEIDGWVTKCEEFLEFLNGRSPSSVQIKLSQAEPDTILDKMKQSEQRKIARVATELAALTQSFKGFLAQSENPNLKYV